MPKKTELEWWYAKQVANDYTFNLRRDMEDYCVSDVKLVKAGCHCFQAEFQKHVDFNLMEKCVPITSIWHRYWSKMPLPFNTIDLEPPRSRHGAQTNQSVKAFQWLDWYEHCLRTNIPTSSTGEPTADHIRHTGNGGEVSIQTPVRSIHVNGY